jgi:hypothetical protein
MRSFTSALSIAVLASGMVAAQSSTTTIDIVEAGATEAPSAGIAGSIVSVNAISTIIAIQCTSSNTDCPITSPWTITQGPSTFSMSVAFSTLSEGVEVELTIDENCKITSSTAGASCTNSVGFELSLDGSKTSTNTIEKPTFTAGDLSYQKLLITAGVEKFSQPQATETPGAAPRIGVKGAAMAMVAGAAAFGLM